jgi:hypothetical protein
MSMDAKAPGRLKKSVGGVKSASFSNDRSALKANGSPAKVEASAPASTNSATAPIAPLVLICEEAH